MPRTPDPVMDGVRTRVVQGFEFPEADRDCSAVVFGELPKLLRVIGMASKLRCCVQAGGNVGVFPAELAAHFRHVYTFEPDAENFECLMRNVTAPNVTAARVGLGSVEGVVGIEGDPSNCGAYQLVDGAGDIPVVTIDSLGLFDVDLIYLDIEGMEAAAVKGGLETITRDLPVVVVENKGLGARYGATDADVGKLLPERYRKVERIMRDDVYRCVR